MANMTKLDALDGAASTVSDLSYKNALPLLFLSEILQQLMGQLVCESKGSIRL